ncbi:hypothetical protein D1AOALGA4SA_18 [Olavius algarvensis Delta 1 endosymbiont]|nr:hypothetical protein D1AOALGA4SA_18 [Olavius algarvensis Delta 1 endosymbiont]
MVQSVFQYSCLYNYIIWLFRKSKRNGCGSVLQPRYLMPRLQTASVIFYPSIIWVLNIEPAHKLKIDQNKLQNCRSNILNLVNVL